MARTRDDVYEDEVRRRLTEAMAAAGVDQQRASLEVLYLLPAEFVRTYRALFDMAVQWAPQSAGSGGKDEGQVKSSGSLTPGQRKASGEHGMHTRVQGGAKSGGKRYHRQNWAIRSEAAIDAKRRLDRALVRATTNAIRAAARESSNSTRDVPGTSDIPEVRVMIPACRRCGSPQGIGWLRCPYHADE